MKSSLLEKLQSLEPSILTKHDLHLTVNLQLFIKLFKTNFLPKHLSVPATNKFVYVIIVMFSSTAKLVTKIIFFINLANLAFLFTHLSWDTFLKIPTMQNAFFDHEVLK